MIDREARAESLAAFRGRDTPLGMDEAGVEIEDLETFIGELKPLRYAKWAEVMSAMLADMSTRRQADAADGLWHSEVIVDDPWSQLYNSTISAVYDSLKGIGGSEAFQYIADMNDFIGRLDPERYVDPKLQLVAGAGTAAGTMLTLLKNIPVIVGHHDDTIPLERLADVARSSVSLSWSMAMTCVDQLMAAQTTLSGGTQHEGWHFLDRQLDPQLFRLNRHTDGSSSLRYSDFYGLEVAEGYDTVRYGKLAKKTLLQDLDCMHTTIIGCPITLVSGAMQELWEWYIDAVEAQGLWAKS